MQQQSVRFVMREVGQPNGTIISAQDFSAYLEDNFLSRGYKIWKQFEEPIRNGTDFLGYRVFVTLVRDEIPVPVVSEPVKK